MYKVAHGSQISSAKEEEEKVEEVGTCGPKRLMGARRPGAVGSLLKLHPSVARCSAFTWSPKLETPLTFQDVKKNIPKKPPQVFRLRKVVRDNVFL